MRSKWWLLVGLVVAVFVAGYVQNHDSHQQPGLQPATSVTTGSPAGTSGAKGSFTVSDLPREAQRTLALIDNGGPYPYRQDNTVFGNREHLLPSKPNGYYREFAVVTPGSDDRGPRRLIRGKEGETYYTSDHYASFHRVERN